MGAGPIGYGSGPYRGLKIPKVQEWHKNLTTFMGTTMWLWLFWRCYYDGKAFLGLEHPWDHGHGHDDHGHDDHGHDDEHH